MTPEQARDSLLAELTRRTPDTLTLHAYYNGDPPLPVPADGIAAAAAAEYRALIRQSRTNWPRLLVDAADERLAVEAFRMNGADEAWSAWQAAGLDAWATLAHTTALISGAAYVMVWPEDGSDTAGITVESPTQCIVQYDPARRTRRVAALKAWDDTDAGIRTAELYTPETIYRWTAEIRKHGKTAWSATDEGSNPLGVVPVVEIRSPESLIVPHIYGGAPGDIRPHLDIVDRINTTVFGRLLAAAYAAFPVRVVMGVPIRRDAKGAPVPLATAANRMLQFEEPDAKVQQLPESNLAGYVTAAEADIKHLAAVSRTPANYLLGDMVNLSADAIRAGEAALIARVRRHQRHFGEGWEEVARLCLRAIRHPGADDTRAETVWSNPETRSIAERADAVVKLTGAGFPWQYGAELMGLSPDKIAELQRLRAADALATPTASVVLPADTDSGTDAIKARADALTVLIRAGVNPEAAAAQVGLTGVQFTGAAPTSQS